MREKALRMVEFLQTMLFHMAVAPFVFTIIWRASKNEFSTLVIWLISFAFLIPMWILKYVSKRFRYVLVYAGVYLVLIFAEAGYCFFIVDSIFMNSLQMWIFTIIGQALMLVSFTLRLSNSKKAFDPDRPLEEEQRKWVECDGFLDKPNVSAAFFLVVSYVGGLLFYNPKLSDLMLASMLVYVILFLVYQYLHQMEDYLHINRTVHNLPSKRMYRVSSAIVCLALILVLVIGGLSFTTRGNRHYTDLRDIEQKIHFTVEMPDQGNAPEQEMSQADVSLYEMMKHVGQPPAWLIYFWQILEYVVTVALIVGIAYALVMKILHFKHEPENTDDIVESLVDIEEKAERVVRTKEEAKELSKRNQIRKRYRKAVRSARKDLPQKWETPIEIETLADEKKKQSLSEQRSIYEAARYGDEKSFEAMWKD